jgi:hypothetical protein
MATLLWLAIGCGNTAKDSGLSDTTAVPGTSAATPATGPATVPATTTAGPQATTSDGAPAPATFESFDKAKFSNPTVINNEWLPLAPGTRQVLSGTSVENGEELAHRLVYVVTNLTKEIDGVKTVVAWIEDYSNDELVEVELAFYAQDDAGNVWFFGEHPEEYEDEKFVASPTWIAGVEDARAGIEMYAKPDPGRPPYFEGWAPAVQWSDYGTVSSVGIKACVALGCYDEVLTIAESSLKEAGITQLKSYARGVGPIQVDFQGADQSRERLEVVESGPLSAVEIGQYRALARALETHAYGISPAYASTLPMKAAATS